MNYSTHDQNRLREWRERQRLTLEELADLTGISISMLSRVERAERRLSAQTKVLIARRLDVPIRELFPIEALENLAPESAS